MSQAAQPRMARFVRASSNPHRPILVGRIYGGPQTEMGRLVHIPIHKEHITEIRAFLDRLEAEDDC